MTQDKVNDLKLEVADELLRLVWADLYEKLRGLEPASMKRGA